MRIAIRHQFTIDPGLGIVHAVQHLLLTPQSGAGQAVLDWHIEMEGMERAARFTDAFGNVAHLVSQARITAPLEISVAGTVETTDRSGIVGWPTGEPIAALFRRVTPLTEARPDIVEGLEAGEGGRIALLHAIMARVGEAHAEPRQMQSTAPLKQEQGAPADATDMAHAFIGAARTLSIPARFVSGYLAGGEAPHAWAEAYDEGLGWIGFDPSLQLCPSEEHVRVAIGLDADTARPVRGVPAAGEERTLGLSVAAGQ